MEMEKKIKSRIAELQKEMQTHQQRRQQANQVLTQETLQIAAKEGAILELQNLLPQKKNQKI